MDAPTGYQRRDEVQIIDVREDDEWAAGRIAGAVHIPLAQLPMRLDELADGGTYVTVCRSGGRSSRAHALLTSAGKHAEDLDGGMQAWAGAGLPVVTLDGLPGQVI